MGPLEPSGNNHQIKSVAVSGHTRSLQNVPDFFFFWLVGFIFVVVVFYFILFYFGTHYIDQADLQRTELLLPPPPKYWGDKACATTPASFCWLSKLPGW